tara:strand:- start:1146 stop:1814 length:669 start_codon:yes stop_codon:yes gene_type:complete
MPRIPRKPNPVNSKATIDRIRKDQDASVVSTVFANVEAQENFKSEQVVEKFLKNKYYDKIEKIQKADAEAFLKARKCINAYDIPKPDDLFETATAETTTVMKRLSDEIVDLQSKNKTLQELVSEKSQALVAETAKVAVLTEKNQLQNNEIVQLNASVASLSEQLKISGAGCGTELDDCKKKLEDQQTVYNAILDDLRSLLTKMSPGSEDGDGSTSPTDDLKA